MNIEQGDVVMGWWIPGWRLVLVCSLALVVAASSRSLADPYAGPSEHYIETTCARVSRTRPPGSDLPSRARRLALKDCDAQAMLFGIGRGRDPVEARHCAFAQLASAQDGMSYHGDNGAAVLAMIYANGDGVVRNPDVSRHYLCHASLFVSTHDLEVLLKRVSAIESAPRQAGRLDFCGETGSSAWLAECMHRDSRIAGAARDRAVASLTRDWSPAQKAALGALRRAEARFSKEREAELYRSGLLYRARVVDMRERLQSEGQALLKRLSRRGGFSATPGQRVLADRRLNAAYRRVMGIPVEADLEVVQPADVRKAERAWILYRDAWLALARTLGRPRSDIDGLAVEVTELRTTQLACAAAIDPLPDHCRGF